MCAGKGLFKVDRCYQEYAADVALAFDAFEFAESKILPVAGGWLDQTQSFLDALRVIKQEKALCKTD